jgi:hypothetical protein
MTDEMIREYIDEQEGTAGHGTSEITQDHNAISVLRGLSLRMTNAVGTTRMLRVFSCME